MTLLRLLFEEDSLSEGERQTANKATSISALFFACALLVETTYTMVTTGTIFSSSSIILGLGLIVHFATRYILIIAHRQKRGHS